MNGDTEAVVIGGEPQKSTKGDVPCAIKEQQVTEGDRKAILPRQGIQGL
jgi:hypothetical protein